MADNGPLQGSRRRQVTILFADVSGFTAMSERNDPEEVTEVMDACFRMLEGVVRRHGGVVDKYIGDCVMALFGAPDALEHAARCGLQAALEIRSRLEKFKREHRLPTPLGVHIGVNTGEVIAGEIGGEVKRDFTVMGDAVNLASRLEDASQVGQILVGPTTYAFTRGHFEFRKLKPLALKGKSESVQAWELINAKRRTDAPRRESSARQIASGLIGRRDELAALGERVRRVIQGEGGIVGIVADAGLGKSRIVAELAGLPELQGLTLLEGKSQWLGRSLSFHPFQELLRGWAGIKEDEGDEAALARLESAVASVARDQVDEIIPFVATLLGLRVVGDHAERLLGSEGDALERLIVKAMVSLFRALAESAPLILFFDDVHWADLSSIKLLEALHHLVASHRLLFLYAARPDHPDTAGRLLTGACQKHGDRYLHLTLAPLGESESAQLIRSLLRIDELPHQLRALIARKAEGNPFFIEEILRWFIDQGALEVAQGQLHATDKIDSVVIPGTVQEVILVRIEQLPASHQRLLQIGAVMGRAFLYRILVEVLGPLPDMQEWLAHLVERQLLSVHDVRNFADVRHARLESEREYIFKHALIQETIYHSILNRTRTKLHLQVAQAIERMFTDRLADFYGMLAYHYSRANELAKAEAYLFKAGDEAARSAASSEALEYFREASRLYIAIHGGGGDTRKKALLERNIATALLNTGNLIDAVPHYDRALAYLGETVPRTTIRVYRRFARDIAAILFRMYVRGGIRGGNPATEDEIAVLSMMYNRARAQLATDAKRFFFDSMATVRRLTDLDPATVPGAFAVYAGGAIFFAVSGLSYSVSRRFISAAKSLIREDCVADLFTYRLMKYVCNYFEGKWDEPSEIDDTLIEHTLRFGQVWDVDTFLGIDAEKSIDEGRFANAEARLAKIIDIAQSYGYDYARSNQYALTTFLALAQRRLDDALAAVERYCEERPENLLNLLGLGTKAKILLLRREKEEARVTIEQAENLLSRLGLPPPFYYVGSYRVSRFLFDLMELEAASATGGGLSARRARKVARKDGAVLLKTAAKMARLRTESYRLLGRYYWHVGARRRALRWYSRSLREGERLGALPELARTCLEVSRRLSGSASIQSLDGQTAEEFGNRARGLFRSLGLVKELAELVGGDRVTHAA